MKKKKKEKKKGKKKQGSRKACLFGASILVEGTDPCTPELRLFEGTALDLRRGARVGSCVALHLGAPFTTMADKHGS